MLPYQKKNCSWFFLAVNLLQAKELEVNTQYYIELLAKGIGKTQEEIAKDIQIS